MPIAGVFVQELYPCFYAGAQQTHRYAQHVEDARAHGSRIGPHAVAVVATVVRCLCLQTPIVFTIEYQVMGEVDSDEQAVLKDVVRAAYRGIQKYVQVSNWPGCAQRTQLR
jgi:hypothetical protein